MTILFPSPVFGPVQSRRLGCSLGINVLPADGKVCSFDCIYCECGLNAERRPKEALPSRAFIRSEVQKRLEDLKRQGERVDALTFAGNGEPTSHPDFEGIVEDMVALRDEWVPNASLCLLTNATHLMKPSVARAIRHVDRPCFKLDTVDDEYIHAVDRPTSRYRVAEVIEAIQGFQGRCIIQTMFMKGTWQGQNVDNTDDRYVLSWLKVLKSIHPMGVDVYTLSRETPSPTLEKATPEDLDRIVALVKAQGIDAHAYY